ncbi:hypothetical protein DBV15_01259 [Temnothorax longispinosus]|uniref:Uncharacterized protein n=1 Tax=Temnothorax longispinosus TaxID=300112 RepID=A0A4S2KKI3_9HYME|nr:hypothetical protein DBV15_01259 [Temnothorax longispinosus]
MARGRRCTRRRRHARRGHANVDLEDGDGGEEVDSGGKFLAGPGGGGGINFPRVVIVDTRKYCWGIRKVALNKREVSCGLLMRLSATLLRLNCHRFYNVTRSRRKLPRIKYTGCPEPT